MEPFAPGITKGPTYTLTPWSVPLSKNLPFGNGGMTYQNPGVYSSAVRDIGTGIQVPGFPQVTNGTPTIEPPYLGRMGIHHVIGNASQQPGEGIVVTIPTQIWGNGWEAHLQKGSIVFQIIDSDTALGMNKNYPSRKDESRAILATVGDLNTLFETAEDEYQTRLARRIRPGDTAFLPTNGGGGKDQENPFAYIRQIKEKFWAFPEKDPLAGVPEDKKAAFRKFHNLSEAHQLLVKRLYSEQHTIGFRNSIWIREHIHKLGVVDAVTSSGDPNNLLVSVVIYQKALVKNLWGRHLANGDRCMFIVTKHSQLRDHLLTATGEYQNDPFVIYPVRNPSEFQPSLPIHMTGKMKVESAISPNFTYTLITPGSKETRSVTAPNVVFEAGVVIRRDIDNFNSEQASADPQQSKGCLTLFGLGKSKADANDAFIAANVDTSVLLYVNPTNERMSFKMVMNEILGKDDDIVALPSASNIPSSSNVVPTPEAVPPPPLGDFP